MTRADRTGLGDEESSARPSVQRQLFVVPSGLDEGLLAGAALTGPLARRSTVL